MRIRRTILAVSLIFALAGCAEERVVGTSPVNHIAYEKYGIMRLRVGEIKIQQDYQPTYHAPNLEHLLLVPPYTAIRDWAKNRFQAVGNMGIARVEILDASVTQKDTTVPDEFLGFNNSKTTTQFLMRLRVRIEVDAPAFYELPYAEATVTRKLTYPGPTTFAEHEGDIKNALVGAIDQLDAVMTRTLHDKWGSIVE